MEKPISTNDSMKMMSEHRVKMKTEKHEKEMMGGGGKTYPKGKKAKGKVKKVMGEWKSGELHSGSKKGPVVKKQSQAVAIALSEARKAKKT